MKHNWIIGMGLLFLSLQAIAQTDYSGKWKGAIELPGVNLEISIHFQRENEAWKGFLSIPIQQVKDMELGELVIQGREIRFKLPEVPGNASFSGSFDEKAENVAGAFSQSGQQFPMRLARSSAAEKAAETKRLSDAVAVFRHLVDSLRQKRHMPGLAIGIIKDGTVLMEEGFGYRDIENKLPVTAQTMFAIGSSTKAFTAAGLAILADKGALDWDKPVVQYMPDFQLYDPFSTQAMNATDLCCHRSGLPRHDIMWYGSSFTRQQIYGRLRYLKPNKSLRTTWQYNNLMFMTAGCLVEKLSGKSWEAFVESEIFEPLGMKSSHFTVEKLKKNKDAAVGYATTNDKNSRLEYRNIDAVGPAGSINSNVTDMLKWVKLHLNKGAIGSKQLISKAEISHMHSPQMLMNAASYGNVSEITDPSYGLGWMLYRYKGQRVVEHGGNIDGFSALVYMLPDKDFGLVILTNQNGAALPGLLARYASDIFLGLEPTDWYVRTYGSGNASEEPEQEPKIEKQRISGTQPSRPLKAYTGDYEHPGYGHITVSENGNQLQIRLNNFSLPLSHWHYDVFQAKDSVLELEFLFNFMSDLNGNIDRISTPLDPLGGEEIFLKAAPERLFDPVFLQQLAGKYTFEAQDRSCTFELRNKTLYLNLIGQPEYTLVPFQQTEFKLKDLNGYSVAFVLNEQGKPEAVKFIQPNGIFTAIRVK